MWAFGEGIRGANVRASGRGQGKRLRKRERERGEEVMRRKGRRSKVGKARPGESETVIGLPCAPRTRVGDHHALPGTRGPITDRPPPLYPSPSSLLLPPPPLLPPLTDPQTPHIAEAEGWSEETERSGADRSRADSPCPRSSSTRPRTICLVTCFYSPRDVRRAGLHEAGRSFPALSSLVSQ